MDKTFSVDELAKAGNTTSRGKRLGFCPDEIRVWPTNRTTAVMTGAIKRIEELMTDTDVKVTELRLRLAQISRKEMTP